MSDVVFYMRHVREAKLCASGARQWFQRNGFSWTDFIENGMCASRVRPLNDEFANRVIALAEQEAKNGRRG